MATSSTGIQIIKPLLVWPMPISDKVGDLFTMVSANLSELLKYVSKEITKTDTFHLIIPLDCFEDLMNDPVHEFSQVQHIDVYYDHIDDLEQIQRRFNLKKCEKVYFCSAHNLLQRFINIALDNALISSDSIDRNTINAIISAIKDHISAKRFITPARHSQVLKKFSSNFLHGFPVKNMNEINSCFFCPSCKLQVFQQLYQLECGHRKCAVCLNIQKSCTTCSTVVSRDKVLITIFVNHYFVPLRSFFEVWFDQEFQILMQNLTISCSSCQWKGLLEAYQEHLKENHHQLFTCLVRNLIQVDDNNFHQVYPIETNQQNFLDNLSLLSSDLSIASLNGTCVWEISGIDALRNNAAAADQRKSIYSCPFYSFPNGYKICLRIFLNGDAKARDTHISLFFVLMKSDYDDNLEWPFKFKVTFTLLNHVSSNDNQSQSFWPDTTSKCFQCPRSDMNIAYGISNCFSLDLFKKNQTQYVLNDTIFIKVEVDFLSERPDLPLIAGAGELPNEEEHGDRTYNNLSHLFCGPGALK